MMMRMRWGMALGTLRAMGPVVARGAGLRGVSERGATLR